MLPSEAIKVLVEKRNIIELWLSNNGKLKDLGLEVFPFDLDMCSLSLENYDSVYDYFSFPIQWFDLSNEDLVKALEEKEEKERKQREERIRKTEEDVARRRAESNKIVSAEDYELLQEYKKKKGLIE